MQYIKQQDGFIEEITEDLFNKLPSSFFRAYNKTQTICFINCDSKNIVPYIKDILNRKHKFLEIKLLISLLIFTIIFILLQIFSFFYLDFSNNFVEQNKKIEELKTIIDTNKTPEDNPYNEVKQPIRHKNIITN